MRSELGGVDARLAVLGREQGEGEGEGGEEGGPGAGKAAEARARLAAAQLRSRLLAEEAVAAEEAARAAAAAAEAAAATAAAQRSTAALPPPPTRAAQPPSPPGPLPSWHPGAGGGAAGGRWRPYDAALCALLDGPYGLRGRLLGRLCDVLRLRRPAEGGLLGGADPRVAVRPSAMATSTALTLC
jgi:hypothetical protein